MKNSPKDKKRDQIPFNHEFCDSFEQASKFGTYEIQPTADNPNMFPAISQGLPSENVAEIPEHFHEGVVPKLND